MMRNNLLNFAEFERETIAARVADAYQTKARETGFYQGGNVQFGYIPERREVNGKMGSVLVPSENAEAVRIAFEIYQQYGKSLADIINYYVENNVNATRPTRRTKSGLSNMDRSHLSRILQNPLYVRADKEVYAYFAAKGYEILDDITAYDGVHGVFMHKSNDGTDGTYVKIGYHEGLVDAKLMEKLADADNVLFDYIQSRISSLHTQKSDIERRMQTMKRKRQAIDTKPLTEPMSRWEELTVQERHELAAAMIDVVYVSDEKGVEVKFSI